MKHLMIILFLGLALVVGSSTTTSTSSSADTNLYDYSASIECKSAPDDPLYNGGILKNQVFIMHKRRHQFSSPTFVLYNLTGDTIYSFSSWVKISGADSAVVKASLTTDNPTFKCLGTVIAKSGCWSFLKGGFVLDSPSTYARIYFQIFLSFHSGYFAESRRATNKHIGFQCFSAAIYSPAVESKPANCDKHGKKACRHITRDRCRWKDVTGGFAIANTILIVVHQVSRDFPFGSAIANTILGNLPYQNWLVERFNAAVFENELKWYATEPRPDEVNYTIPDQLLEFVRANQITVRGHNIFWEDPKYNPSWVRNLTTPELKSAVHSRIQSLMSKYRNEFVHWDVDNEMLHWDFYEQRLGPAASLEFFQTAQKSDPLARLFMNEFNVLETCDDMNSTVDHYVSRLQELGEGGVFMDGIGLEGHLTVPNPPLIRAILDKLAALKHPIWLTEVDISKTLDQETQVKYLEIVLRESFAHPSVNGIMLWTALHPSGCYQMCLTDDNFQNLPAGDTAAQGMANRGRERWDFDGVFNFSGFLGEYEVTVNYNNRTTNSTFSLCGGLETGGLETKHWNIHL